MNRFPCALLAVALFTSSASPSPAADTWHAPEATVRFQLALTEAPSHPSAGYLVVLPDGGALPAPVPIPRVFTTDGNELKPYVLWHQKEAGLVFVFAPPSSGSEVLLYVHSAGRPTYWTPESGLTPVSLLCTRSGTGVKADAMQLARPGEPQGTISFHRRPGMPKAPLCISGDLTGRGGPASHYMLTHVVARQAGETWVAPVVFSGDTEVRIDGKTLVPKPASRKAGGTGQSVTLTEGIHRVEIFAWSPNSSGGNGLMTLTWRPPGTPDGELGGKRPSDLPYPGTPMWESRPFKEQELIRSGKVEVRSARTRGGGPVARMGLSAKENYWFQGEDALLLYELTAQSEGHPSDTTYTWTFEGGGTVKGPTVRWLFTGGDDRTVQLTAASGTEQSISRIQLFPYSTVRTSLNQAGSRAAYQNALLQMCRAYPDSADPTANWTDAHWRNLFRTLELNSGADLVRHLMTTRRDVLVRKLAPDQLAMLSEVYLDFAPRSDPAEAAQVLERMEQQARNPVEASQLRLQRAEIMAVYLGRTNEARAMVERIIAQHDFDEAGERARIRLGDLEFRTGRINEATRLYADVQARVKKRRTKAGDTAPDLQLAGKSSKEISAALREGVRPPAAASERVADWKVNTLLDVAESENVMKLIEQGYLFEARQKLRAWERDFPMSKISSDYIVNEARFFMALKDYKRALALLEPYCLHLDATSYLPSAVEAALTCQEQAGVAREQRRAFCEHMKRKLEFHPIATRINDTLERLK